jgi:hypothetical protein
VRDGVAVAALGIPAVSLVTEKFWPQGDFVAASIGMPELPRVKLPHPTGGTGAEEMNRIAADIVPAIIAALRGALRGTS